MYNHFQYLKFRLSRFAILLLVFIGSVVEGNSQTVIKQNLHKNWQFRKVGDLKYFNAFIPGTVHTDLDKNQIISDPFYGCNEQIQQWIENEDWEYRTYFAVDDSILKKNNILLVFEGLDTYANVYLNGKLIIQANNMFRKWSADVKPLLKAENNELRVEFESAVKKGKKLALTLPYTLPGEEKVFTRKAAYHYGWDWGPRFVTCGIYKPVYIECWNEIKMEDIQIIQKSLSADKAEMAAIFSFYSENSETYSFYVTNELTGECYAETAFPVNIGHNNVKLAFDISDPKLWWTNGLGEAYLYPLQFGIKKKNKSLDIKTVNVGLRTIDLVQQKDSTGKSFYFKLNGIPVFMKGANYIPADNFLSRVDSSKYAAIIKNAVMANMNMLRVWGGGVYENDIFYDLCDKNGILVWQDFMFACAMYPGDTSFLNNVRMEAVENVIRLRNHPCIALWCGNNEIDEGWHNWGWQKQYKYNTADSTAIWKDYQKLFHNLLAEVISAYDRQRFYWPSSPSIGWGRKESMLQGDSHYWGVWWGMESFEIYKQKTGRFMSEYGFQGMPPYSTFLKVAPPDSIHLKSSFVKNHQKHPTGNQTIQTYMERDYKIPSDFRDYLYVSQLLQAEGIKTAIESHRLAKPKCMGTLYWQLNDCWPVTSWSSIDYYNNWKALHYFVRKAYDDILVTVDKKGDVYYTSIISDKMIDTKGNLSVTISDFYGKIISEKQIPVVVKKNSSSICYSFSEESVKKMNKKQIVLKCSFIEEKQDRSFDCIYYFTKVKDLILEKPEISIKKIDDFHFEISTNVLAKNVYLYCEGKDYLFSDNFFDLLPGEKTIIKTENKGIINLIKVKTLADCYPQTEKKNKP